MVIKITLDKIDVLMLTGVYYPEINGAVLQCRHLMAALGSAVCFTVLTQTQRPDLNNIEVIDGVLVKRVFLSGGLFGKIKSTVSFLSQAFFEVRRCNLVHIFGYSNRNALVMVLCSLMGRPVMLRMSSLGLDDPLSVKKAGWLRWRIYKGARKLCGLTPGFEVSAIDAGVSDRSYVEIPNCVDINRFIPVHEARKEELCRKYNVTSGNFVIIFVGHFSAEKQPKMAFDAWVKLMADGCAATLIMVGRQEVGYEVDGCLSSDFRKRATQLGIINNLLMIEYTLDVQELMQLSDVFILPSLREGLPNALMEAMSAGLPCIVSDLPGVAGWLVRDEVNGLVMKVNSTDQLVAYLDRLYLNQPLRRVLGKRARAYIKSNFTPKNTARLTLEMYHNII